MDADQATGCVGILHTTVVCASIHTARLALVPRSIFPLKGLKRLRRSEEWRTADAGGSCGGHASPDIRKWDF